MAREWSAPSSPRAEWFENVRHPLKSAAGVFGGGGGAFFGEGFTCRKFWIHPCFPTFSYPPSTLFFVVICRNLCPTPFLPSGMRKPSVRIEMILNKGILGVKYLF